MIAYTIGVIIVIILVGVALSAFHDSFKEHDIGRKNDSAKSAILGLVFLFLALVAARIAGI